MLAGQPGITSWCWALLMAAADAGVPSVPAAAPRLLAPLPTLNQSTNDRAGDYRLQRATDGSGDLLYDATAFTARIARDGTVAFDARHVSALKLIPFLPGPPPANAPTLEGTLRSLRQKGRAPSPPRNANPTADETRWPADTVSRYRADPREACQYPRSCFFDAKVVLLGTSATLDVGDELARLAGHDPYRYQKARFLAATHEMRIRMAARAHADDIQRSAAELPRRLRAIACDRQRTLAERRGTLEALRAELDAAPDADSFRRAIDIALGELSPDAACVK